MSERLVGLNLVLPTQQLRKPTIFSFRRDASLKQACSFTSDTTPENHPLMHCGRLS